MTDRRQAIIDKIVARCITVDTGFMLHGKMSPCQLWTGPTSGDGRGGGYGRMSLNGRTVAVHLVAFTHWFGYIPGGKQVDHLCRNRLCCAKDHLELVTHKQNQRRRDQAKK